MAKKFSTKERVKAMVHISDMLTHAKHNPTIRETGIDPDLIGQLVDEKLIRLFDNVHFKGEYIDKHGIFEITPTGTSFILTNQSLLTKKSLWEKTRSAVGKKLWDLLWDGAKIILGFVLGFLWKKYIA